MDAAQNELTKALAARRAAGTQSDQTPEVEATRAAGPTGAAAPVEPAPGKPAPASDSRVEGAATSLASEPPSRHATAGIEPEATGDLLAGLRRGRAELRPQLGVRVRSQTVDRLRRFATEHDVSRQDIVDLAINQFIDQYETGERA